MPLTPEYLYPLRPMHFRGAYEDIGIGMSIEDYPPNPNGWTGLDRKITFYDVRDVDLSGYPDDKVEVEVFEFLNGVKLYFENMGPDGTEQTKGYGRFIFKYNGQQLTVPGAEWNYQPTSFDNIGRTDYHDLKNCKFYITAFFPYPVAPGITPCDGVYFDIMMQAYKEEVLPTMDLATAIANLEQVRDNNTAWLGSKIMWAPSDTTIAGAPDHYRVGIGSWSYVRSTGGGRFQISNLNIFNNYMKTAGRGTNGRDIYDADEDPAGTNDPSRPGGGGGNYDDTSNPIDFPDLPTGGALECGAVVAHRVSKQTLEAIMSKLWDNSIFNISNSWQKSIQDPMDAIVSLHALPFSPTVNGPTKIWIGNFDTELTSPEVTSQYITVDCGTLNVEEYWGSALDYSPYTRAEIYLPFCGVKDVSIEDVMNSVLEVKYNIDVLTGDCIAFLKCGQSVLYHFEGNCKMQIPLTSKTTDAITNAGLGIGAIVSAGGAVATGGSSLLIAGATVSAASSVAGSKVRTGRGSELSGSVSLLDDFIPYLIIHRPVQSLAKDYNKFKGYPSNITASLGGLSGYTEVEHIHLRNIPNATSAEMEEIKNLLKTGVLL